MKRGQSGISKSKTSTELGEAESRVDPDISHPESGKMSDNDLDTGEGSHHLFLISKFGFLYLCATTFFMLLLRVAYT